MTQGAARPDPLLTWNDLTPFADIDKVKAQAMIDDAIAKAALVAPCILTAEFDKRDAAKAILRGAVLRWNDSGSGALQTHSQSAGPWTDSKTIDTRQKRGGMFWPSEIEDLQKLCAKSGSGGAFSIDTASDPAGGHLPWCNLMFGANYCSCGADLNRGVPLFEGGTFDGGD